MEITNMGRSLKEDRRDAMGRGGEARGRKRDRELPSEYAATPLLSSERKESLDVLDV